jgi:hypothetical protein
MALAAFGCQDRQPRIESTAEWSGWMGDTTIDPTGDLKKLQGKWVSIPPRIEDAAEWPESYLVIDGDIALFKGPGAGDEGGRARKPGEMPSKYRIVINSGVEPKVIRYTHSLDGGEPVPL